MVALMGGGVHERVGGVEGGGAWPITSYLPTPALLLQEQEICFKCEGKTGANKRAFK